MVYAENEMIGADSTFADLVMSVLGVKGSEQATVSLLDNIEALENEAKTIEQKIILRREAANRLYGLLQADIKKILDNDKKTAEKTRDLALYGSAGLIALAFIFGGHQ